MKKIFLLKSLFMLFFFFTFISFNFMFSSKIFFLDKLSFFMVAMTIMVFFCSSLAKKDYSNSKNFFFSILIFIAFKISLIFFLSQTITWFFFFFEASIIPIFLLIVFWGYQMERIQAGYYMFIYTLVFSLPFFCFLSIFSKSFLMSFFSNNFFISSPLIFIIMITLFLVKLPIYFLHLWLPKAHVESPVMGSMILAGVLLKLGGYGLLRILILCWNQFFSNLLFLLSFMGVLMSTLICALQSDQKSMIAYSSVGHMTILLVVISTNTIFSVKTFVLLMFTHGLCSSILFFSSYKFFLVSSNRLIQLNQGFLFKFMLFFTFFMFFIFMNFNVPPMPTFFIEIFIMSSITSFKKMSMLLVFAMVFLSCYYSIFLLVNSFHGKHPIEKFFFMISSDFFLFIPFILFSTVMISFLSTIF